MLLTPTDMPLMPFFTRLGIDARVIPTMSNYTVSKKKKRPQYSRHNFVKFSHSFVIFGTNHPDISAY